MFSHVDVLGACGTLFHMVFVCTFYSQMNFSTGPFRTLCPSVLP